MNISLKDKARKLRKNGKSFREISEELEVSKSTASLWARDEKMSAQGQIRFSNLIEFSHLKARKILFNKQEKYLKELDANCDVLRDVSHYTRNDLKVFLALLYWGEGAKAERRLSFINSDPDMIFIYLKLLRSSFNIKEDKLRASLHLHSYHNQSEMVSFWSKVTGIDKERIGIYNKVNSGIQKKDNYRGCIAVRYCDYKIFDEVMLIIKRFSDLKI